MVTVEHCRQVLGPRCTLSDTNLQAVRDQLYALAPVVVSVCLEQARHLKEKRRRTTSAAGATNVRTAATPFNVALGIVSEDEREGIEEHAAILEYEAGFDRDTAERKAVADWLAGRR